MVNGWRIFKLDMVAFIRRVKRIGIRRPNCQARYVAGCPERLLIAPQDLRTADPTLANDIYSGLFVFAGQVENCDARSPFRHPAPSSDWSRELHGFRWLRHLKASDASISRSNAQALVDDWILQSKNLAPEAWEMPVLANRILAWLNNSPLILQNSDHDFYRRFIRALYLQLRYLRASQASSADTADRLLMLVAECAGWLCLSGKDRYARSAAKRLAAELDSQILPDGGHVSRNSLVLVHILLELLPLRQAFLSRDMVLPEGIGLAIERMMPMLRFFRHPNGAMAHFNGVGTTPVDMLATVLAYDEIRGAPVSDASWSGYQRMEAGSTTLIMDTGTHPPLEQSTFAHAGNLSFELSIGNAICVINCGAPSPRHDNWRELARGTAAHSTLSIQDNSTCQLATKCYDLGGRPVLSGPSETGSERSMDGAQETIHAHHNGYASRFGIRHERQIWMAIDGRRIDGQDDMQSVGKGIKKGNDRFAVRFHLHPSVQIEPSDSRDLVYLGLANGEIWQFCAKECEISIEDSVFLSDIHGIRPTKQLVLHGYASHVPTVNWHFERLAFADEISL